MTDKIKTALQDHLGDDINANVSRVTLDNGEEIAILRADVLDMLMAKAREYDAQNSDQGENDKDAFTLLEGK